MQQNSIYFETMRTLFLLALIAFSAVADAQNFKFYYSKLTQSTLVTSKTNSSYIRKTPSAKAPYLMYGCRDETDDCTFMWSNKVDRMYNPEPYMVTSSTVALVVPDSKAKDFYRICVGTNSDNFFEAYLAKVATKPVNAMPITRKELRDEYFGYWIFPEGSGLQDVIVGLDSDELYGVSNLMLGTIQNGLLVFAHSIPGYFLYDESVSKLTIKENANGNQTAFLYGPKQCRPLSETSNHQVLDLGKLTTSEKKQLLLMLQAGMKPNTTIVRAKYAGPNESPQIRDIYWGNGVNGDFTAVSVMDLHL